MHTCILIYTYLQLANLPGLAAMELCGPPPLSVPLSFLFSTKVIDLCAAPGSSMAARNANSCHSLAANILPTVPSPHSAGSLLIDLFNRYLMSLVLTTALTTINETSPPSKRSLLTWVDF